MGRQQAIPQIVPCDDPRVFTLAEAQAMFPLVRRITEAAYHELEPVRRKLEAMIPANPRMQEVERQYETIVGHYHGYHEGFGSRRPLREIIEELDPDWAHL
jgi:hypothetical protein